MSNELAPWIAGVCCKKFVVLKFCAGLPLDVSRPLKRHLVIRSHTREAWDRWVNGFKISKVQRVFQPIQRLAEFGAEPRFPRLHASSCPPLNLRQVEVVRYFANGLDARLLKLLHRAGMDAGQVSDMVIRARRITTVEKLAGNGIGAVPSRRDVGYLRHGEHGELGSKLERELGLQPLDLPGQVPNAKETYGSMARRPDKRSFG